LTDSCTIAPNEPLDGKSRRLLAVVLLVGAVLRIVQIPLQSLTMDEVYDLGIARGGWKAIAEGENRFPPLYHILLAGWLKVCPWDQTGRGLSVVFGLMTILATRKLAEQLGDRRAGLAAAAVAALAPLAVWHDSEVRPYSLYLLLGATAIWLWTAAMQSHCSRAWAWFAVTAIAGAYSHYYFGLLIAIAGLTMLAARPSKGVLVRGLIAFAVVGVACLPVLVLLRGDLDQPWGYSQTSRFTPPALGYAYFSLIGGYSLGPSPRALHGMAASEAIARFLPWAIPLAAATAILLAVALRSGEPTRRPLRWLTLIAFTLAPPLVVGFASVLAGFGFSPRHVVWSASPLWALLGAGLSAAPSRGLRRVAAAVLLVGALASYVHRSIIGDYMNEDARSAAQYVVAHSSEIAPVFALSGYQSEPLKHYLPSEWTAAWLPDAQTGKHGKELAKLATDAIREKTPAGGQLWLAYSRAFHGDPDGELLKALTSEFSLEKATGFPGFDLYRGRR
jgi:4-amino-4-deoxy-L-arabinose transferase-like glycosyltransferase